MERDLRADEQIDNAGPEVVGYQDARGEEARDLQSNHAREGTARCQGSGSHRGRHDE